MRIICAEKIRLYPNKRQESLLRQAVGHARFAYNWALAEWKRQYDAGGKPNANALNRQLNSIKREQFPWMLDVSKRVVQEAIMNLGNAFDRFFKKQSKYPKFKNKKGRQSARIDNGPGTFKVDGNKIFLPKIGWLTMAVPMRRKGKLLSSVVSLEGGNIWHVAVTLATEIEPIAHESQVAIGVDLGIKAAATLSNGETFESPNPLRKKLKRLRHISRMHSRKQLGSNNRKKSALRLARLHWRIANVRRDFTNKMTIYIVRNFPIIAIEDLKVSDMIKDKSSRRMNLSRLISDVGFYEIRRQLEYKSKWYGSEIVFVDKLFPSSKMCSFCGKVNDNLKLSKRRWSCDCGASHDRDVNAAKNLAAYALRRVTS